MATNFPTTLDTLVNPIGSNPLTAPSHAGQHTDINDAVEALQAKVGVNSSAVTTSLDYKVGQLSLVSIEEETASYTLVLTDAYKSIEMNVATANNLTVPPNSSVAFPVGTQIIVLQTNTGQTTLVAGAGVTINAADAKLKLRARWSSAVLIKRATDTWVAVGDLAA